MSDSVGQNYNNITGLFEDSEEKKRLRFHDKKLEEIPSTTSPGSHYFDLIDEEGSVVDGIIWKRCEFYIDVNFFDERANFCASKTNKNLAHYLRLTNENISEYRIEVI